MPRVIVETDDGQRVYAEETTAHTLLFSTDSPPAQALIGGIRRGLQDAEAVEAGLDPERPSEKAMRLAEEQLAREAR
jgi:hypothetical protein